VSADCVTLAGVLAGAMYAEGMGPGGGVHSWRCEHPDRYGKCACVEEVAADIAKAVRDHLAALTGDAGVREACAREATRVCDCENNLGDDACPQCDSTRAVAAFLGCVG